METNENKTLENIERICTMCLSTLKQDKDKSGIHIAEIRVYDYFELGAVIRNLLKLCIVALDHDAAEVPSTVKNKSIDVSLILGIALQLFPIDEFELLNEINTLFPVNCAGEEKKNDSVQE